jgi:hypothetical protein
MTTLKTGDNVLALRTASSASGVTTKKGMVRPDARDLYNNVGGSLADPYYGNYPWIYPPAEAILINRRATIAAPAYATQVQIVEFDVPQAMQAVITHLVCKFDGSGFVQGSGAVTWTVDINRPLGGGGAQLGYSPPDLAVIITQLGDFVSGLPWPIPGGIRLSERDQLRMKVTTAAPVGIGAPNYITGIFLGWYWPARLAFGR